MTALFKARLKQHSRDVVAAISFSRRAARVSADGGGDRGQQSASINKGLAVPRSILIFKLTAE